jgi:hypothetical protein
VHRPSLRIRRIALPLLAAAMLMLQALGLWHGVVHPRSHEPVASVQAHDHAGGDHADGFAGHDDGDGQCRLYDQLAHGDLVFGQAPAFACARVGNALPAAVPAGRLAPQAAGFLARGPPLTA